MSASKPKLKTGQLTLRVHKAQKLYDTQTLGKQDPFVSLQLGEWKKQTKVSQDSGREGVWEEEYAIKLTGFEKELKVEVNHKGLVGQDFIGRCELPMSQFLWGELTPTWYRLGRDVSNNVFAGEIMLSAKFADDDKTQENKEKAAQELIAALQGKVEFLEAAIRQKETDLAEEEVAHSKALDALKIEVAELKEKNAKLTAEAGKVAGLEKKVEKMIPDPVVDECYENFRYAPLKGWKTPYLPTDRWAWSNRQGTEERTKDSCRLPTQDWKWSNDWAVDTTRVGVDKEGFEYAKDFSTEWHSSNTKLDTVRRRRWIRRREYIVPQ